MQRGKQYGCSVHESIVIVTRAGKDVLLCGDIEFEIRSGPMPPVNPGSNFTLGIGRRHKDEESDLEVLCIRAGDCTLNVGGRPTQELAPKVIPSAD